jgi:hypothetical protein
MASYAFAIPVLPGKTDEVRSLAAEIFGPRRKEIDEFQRRTGVTKQKVWLQQTPQGDFSVVYFEADDPARLFQELASSDKPFERWYAQQLKEINGIDPSQPPPTNELIFEWQAT